MRVGAEEGDGTDFAFEVGEAAAEDLDAELSGGWPAEGGGVEVAVAGGEADVFGGVGLDVGVFGGGVFSGLGGAFAEDGPGAGAVDGFAVDLEPCAHLEEDGLGFFGDGAVGFGTYVEEEVAVFADGVDELVDEGFGVAVLVVVDVAPGVDADGGVGLPGEETEGVHLAAFDVEGGGVSGHGFDLVGEDGFFGACVLFRIAVVVVGGELFEGGLELGLADPPIEVDEVGVVLVDELSGAG